MPARWLVTVMPILLLGACTSKGGDGFGVAGIADTMSSCPTVPAIPTGLSAIAGDGQVALTWDANSASNAVDLYQIYRDDQNLDLKVTGTQYTDLGLTNGVAHTYRVSAHNAAGYGDWTAAVSATPTASPTAKPSIPTGLTATPGVGQIVLSWNASPAGDVVIDYQVYRNDLLIAKDVTRTSYTDTGLTYGTTYMYRVSAQNSLGYGDWSGAVSATFGGTFVPGVGIFRQNGEDLSYFSHKEVYSFINTNTWQESVIPQIRAVNVGGKVFVYRSGPDINVNVSDRVQTNTALGLADLQANPALALHYSDGSFASESAPWTDYVLGDVGNPDYQSLWVQRVIDDVRQAGADGVFIDNVLAHFTTLAQNQTKYSTEQQTHDAMLSFVKAVGPKLKAAGILAVGNVLGGLDPNNDIAFAGEVSPYLWGSLREYWEQVPPGVGSYPLEYFQDPSDWRGVFDLTLGWGDAVQNAGGNFFAIQEWNSNDDAASLYGRIAHMLVWNGGAGAFCWGLDYAGDPYSPAWTFNYGEPVAAREQIAAGVWKRAYEGGTVYLNATSSAVTIDGQSVAPHSAMHSP